MNRVYTIGRDPSCDIVISDSTDVVSRVHATLKVKGHGKFVLVDQGRNGTYVNGIRMSPNEEIPVTRKDAVSFAHVADLDWNQVPKEKSKRLMWGIVAVVCLAGIGAALFFVLRPGCGETPQPSQEMAPAVAVPDTVVRELPAKDTVFIREAPEPAPEVRRERKAKKEPAPVRETPVEKEEEVVDAIY